MLGAIEGGRWSDDRFVLAPGETLLFYTDGATDAPGERRALRRAAARASRGGARRPAALVARIDAAIDRFQARARATTARCSRSATPAAPRLRRYARAATIVAHRLAQLLGLVRLRRPAVGAEPLAPPSRAATAACWTSAGSPWPASARGSRARGRRARARRAAGGRAAGCRPRARRARERLLAGARGRDDPHVALLLEHGAQEELHGPRVVADRDPDRLAHERAEATSSGRARAGTRRRSAAGVRVDAGLGVELAHDRRRQQRADGVERRRRAAGPCAASALRLMSGATCCFANTPLGSASST